MISGTEEVKDMGTMMEEYVNDVRKSFQRAEREEEADYKARLVDIMKRLSAQHDLYILQAKAIEPLVEELKKMTDG